ncbi:hypothetical protein NEF87_000457 [Candidatus Lokiarchaeum ossiferum]|uniref:PIN domain-containing protein n=1 Tax=Candidatus Lokiarchaeum ossiferum TaxID=2951803 RepID=A0ABY6HMR2_9ARCH|nr:hypothetical protein NEF87_000457 [Candidatus Lokiarchaeum sp. B-35]
MILADTTFVIDLLRSRHNVTTLQKKMKDETIGLSLLSISELYTGLYYTKNKLGDEVFTKKEGILQKVLSHFEIFELNEAIMVLAGKKRAAQIVAGNPIDLVDLIIGASAKYFCADAILTRNISHFNCWNINILDY